MGPLLAWTSATCWYGGAAGVSPVCIAGTLALAGAALHLVHAISAALRDFVDAMH